MEKKELQKRLMASPFHQWLGIELKTIDDTGIEIVMPWREEVVSNRELQATHGGILASLIDLSGLYSIVAKDVLVGATADLHVDYLRTATPGELRVKSRVIKLGRRTSTAATDAFNEQGKLLATGRGMYLTIEKGQ